MTKWQYRVFVQKGEDTPEMQETLDYLGQDGWELVAVEAHVGPGDKANRMYLKRPLEGEE